MTLKNIMSHSGIGRIKPRVAVCLSGQFRSLMEDNQVVRLIRALDADVFVSTWRELGASSAYDRFFPCSSIARLIMDRDEHGKYRYDIGGLKSSYPRLHDLFYASSEVDHEFIANRIPNVREFRIEPFPQDFQIARRLHGVEYPSQLLELMPERYMYSLPMFYKIYDADRILQGWMEKTGATYDIVIRTRIDIEFSDFDGLVRAIRNGADEGTVYTSLRPKGTVSRELFVNDTFAFGDVASMHRYASLFTNLNEYWDLAKCHDFPLSLRAAECLLGYHLLKKERLCHKMIDIYSPVSVTLNRKSYSEVYAALCGDIRGRAQIGVDEGRAMCILMANSQLESGLDKRSSAELEQLLADVRFYPLYDQCPHSFSWLLGLIYKRLGRSDLAIQQYRVASEFLSGVDVRPALELASQLLQQEKCSEVVALLAPLMVAHPRDYFLLRDLGRVYLKLAEIASGDDLQGMYLGMAKVLLERAVSLSEGKNRIARECLDKVSSRQVALMAQAAN